MFPFDTNECRHEAVAIATLREIIVVCDISYDSAHKEIW